MPAPSTTILWELLVPTQMHGKPIRLRYHRVWDAKVRQISKGLTILHPAKGQWIAPDGNLHEERMIPVRVACTREQIEEIAAMTAKYYQQHTIMFYVISQEVHFREYGETHGLARRTSPNAAQ